MMNTFVLLQLLTNISPAADNNRKTQMSQQITVHAKAGGPSLALPPPTASKPVIDEVLDTLHLGASGSKGLKVISVTPRSAQHLKKRFPEPPFLAFSAKNIEAPYDSWTFEIKSEQGESILKVMGRGRLTEDILWDGTDKIGRLMFACGKKYYYRFEAQFGAGSFAVESNPISAQSFTYQEYHGDRRLEVSIDEIFDLGKATLKNSAVAYINTMAATQKAADKNGIYRFELSSQSPSSKLTDTRIKILLKRLTPLLTKNSKRIVINAVKAQRGEALAAFVATP